MGEHQYRRHGDDRKRFAQKDGDSMSPTRKRILSFAEWFEREEKIPAIDISGFASEETWKWAEAYAKYYAREIANA